MGVYLEMSPLNTGSTYSLAYRTRYSELLANALHPPITGTAMLQTTLGDVQVSPMPFLSTMFGPRMTTKTHDATKGFVQCSPFGQFSPTYYRDTNYSYKYDGIGHPINSRFDYSFVAHASGGDNNLPNASNTSNSGYIITGVNSSDGVPRCVVAELPSRPLGSLGELVNWDLRYENPCPPFAFNLVGNSDATPLLPANAVVNASDDAAKGTQNLRIDDSYCANHLLFDDWFFSGIAPDPTTFGSNTRDQKTTFTDFIKGTTRLALAPSSRTVLDAPANRSEEYPVNLSFRMPGNEQLFPLCETKWRHDPRSRSVVFILAQDGRRSPRVIAFSDYREPSPEKH